MKSKTKINKHIKKKTNSELVETIKLAKKNKAWLEIASILSSSRKNKIEINLNKINEPALVVGKVLSQGEISKKIKVVGLNFSEKAKEKLKKAGCEIVYIKDEIKSNPEMKGLKILK